MYQNKCVGLTFGFGVLLHKYRAISSYYMLLILHYVRILHHHTTEDYTKLYSNHYILRPPTIPLRIMYLKRQKEKKIYVLFSSNVYSFFSIIHSISSMLFFFSSSSFFFNHHLSSSLFFSVLLCVVILLSLL